MDKRFYVYDRIENVTYELKYRNQLMQTFVMLQEKYPKAVLIHISEYEWEVTYLD